MLFQYYQNTPILIGGLKSSDWEALLARTDLTAATRARYEIMYDRARAREFRQQEMDVGYTKPEYPSSVSPPTPSRFADRQSALSILEERLNTRNEENTVIRPEQRLAFAEAAHDRVGEDSVMAKSKVPDLGYKVMQIFGNSAQDISQTKDFQALTDETIRQAVEDCIRRQLDIILNLLGIKLNNIEKSSLHLARPVAQGLNLVMMIFKLHIERGHAGVDLVMRISGAGASFDAYAAYYWARSTFLHSLNLSDNGEFVIPATVVGAAAAEMVQCWNHPYYGHVSNWDTSRVTDMSFYI